ncbi:MAG: hypothetical protein ABSB59_43845 [Streptosporangiaceae bacterium]|jgi:hypothetical protein
MQARPTGETRSITAGRAEATRAANTPANANPSPNADASGAYGPDDPAYGPPLPGWSHQDRPIEDVRDARQPGGAEPVGAAEPGRTPAKADQVAAEAVMVEQFSAEQFEAEQVRAEQSTVGQSTAGQAEPEQPATPPPAATDHHAVRGPFEPLVEHDREPAGPAADHPATDADGRPYEFPGLDDDAPAGSANAALDRLRELHQTAAAVAPQSLDAHFDQLLERQRRLITEYISESEGPSAADASGDDSLVGFGGDFTGTW